MKRPALFLTLIFSLGLLGAGCSQETYPGDKLKESVVRICSDEYGISNVDVKVADQTIGVYLPLKRLFAADFKEAAITGKVRDLESLFAPSPDALEKIDDVLVSLSRVLLSTDRKIEFYRLLATDVDKTGMQLVLSGYVEDIKRVRLWDISRDEYRKRIIHELKLNRAARWHQPVRQFFQDLEDFSLEEVSGSYFGQGLPVETVQNLFFNMLAKQGSGTVHVRWDILDIRSVPVQKDQVLVYTKVLPQSGEFRKKFSDPLQYLFLLNLNEEQVRISRIIPFQYVDGKGVFQRVPFPQELHIEQNLEKWEQEFDVEPIRLGPFLAEQLTRRSQALVAVDERILNTFRDMKLEFKYDQASKTPSFSLNIEAVLSDFNHYTRESLLFHEDMLYLLNIVSREFVTVLRSYRFGSYEYLKLKLAQESTEWTIPRDNLELFRQKKIDLKGMFGPAA